MNKLKHLGLLGSVVLLSGCSLFSSSVNIEPVEQETEVFEYNFSTIFSERDYNETDMYSTLCNIDLSTLTADTTDVTIDNNIVKITKKGTYIFTGTSTDIKIEVDTDEKNQIILDDVTMTHSNDTLIHIVQSDKTFITLRNTNSLTTTLPEESDSGVDGAIFAKDNISINGTGTLDIKSSLNGIAAKDDLTITNGVINIDSIAHAISVNEEFAITTAKLNLKTNGGQEAAPYQESEDGNTSPNVRPGFKTLSSEATWSCKGIKCDELIYIKDGTINIDSYDDAIHSDEYVFIDGGDINIKTGDDAIHSDMYLEINGGNIDIDYCYEGLEAQRLVINDGNINIDSYDDGINAADLGDGSTYIYIHGGEIVITIIEIDNSPEADGLDSNGDILITGGNILVHGTTNTKDTPLDYDGSGEIRGGTFLTAGSYSMTCQNFGVASQGAIYYQLSTSTYYTSDVILKDSSGEIVIQYSPVNKYQVVHLSSPLIKEGETYTLVIGTKSYTIKMTSNIYGTPSH